MGNVKYTPKENPPLEVSEAITSYGGIYELSQSGLSSQWLTTLMDILPLNKTALASLFFISSKTVERYIKSNTIMNPQMSETAIRMYSLSQKGKEIFGSRESFNRWLTKPAFPLNNQPPISFLNTSLGITLVMEELERIEYGTLA